MKQGRPVVICDGFADRPCFREARQSASLGFKDRSCELPLPGFFGQKNFLAPLNREAVFLLGGMPGGGEGPPLSGRKNSNIQGNRDPCTQRQSRRAKAVWKTPNNKRRLAKER
jgi:hypothetical protein